jgi:dihydromonapterin reductase/dihydrofolate reductase
LQPHESALVTGGGRRLGFIIASTLKKMGFEVVIHQRSLSSIDKNSLYQQGYHVIEGDLRDNDCLLSLMSNAQRMVTYPLRIFINNAAIFGKSYHIDDYYEVNVKIPITLMMSFHQYCQHGHIINILDGDIFQNQPGLFDYQWSKKALYQVSMMLKDQLFPRIRINHIAPSMLLKSSNPIDDTFEQRRAKMAYPPTMDDFKKALSMCIKTSSLNGETIIVGRYM